jgi:hypothetical protein
MNKDLKVLLEELRQQGCEISKGNGGHYKIKLPGGKGLVFASSTNPKGRGLANMRARLRARGMEV